MYTICSTNYWLSMPIIYSLTIIKCIEYVPYCPTIIFVLHDLDKHLVLFQMSIQTKGLPVQNPMPIRSLCTAAAPKVEMERALSQEEAVVSSTKVVKNIRDPCVNVVACYSDINVVFLGVLLQNYQDDLQNLGLRIKQHEDHIKSLRTQKNIIEDSILDLKGM